MLILRPLSLKVFFDQDKALTVESEAILSVVLIAINVASPLQQVTINACIVGTSWQVNLCAAVDTKGQLPNFNVVHAGNTSS
jgi:hypothetical protein